MDCLPSPPRRDRRTPPAGSKSGHGRTAWTAAIALIDPAWVGPACVVLSPVLRGRFRGPFRISKKKKDHCRSGAISRSYRARALCAVGEGTPKINLAWPPATQFFEALSRRGGFLTSPWDGVLCQPGCRISDFTDTDRPQIYALGWTPSAAKRLGALPRSTKNLFIGPRGENGWLFRPVQPLLRRHQRSQGLGRSRNGRRKNGSMTTAGRLLTGGGFYYFFRPWRKKKADRGGTLPFLGDTLAMGAKAFPWDLPPTYGAATGNCRLWLTFGRPQAG